MSFPPVKNPLTEALNTVSTLQAAEALGYSLKIGANKSPFRDDRRPSFAIFKDGFNFKDYATGEKGGCWRFTELAVADKGLNWSKADIARFLIGLAGLDTSFIPKPNKTALREKRRAMAVKLYQSRRQSFNLPPADAATHTPHWTPEVEARWNDGVDYLHGHPAVLDKLAASRAWPTHLPEVLLNAGLISLPFQTYQDKARSIAFLVQRPLFDSQNPHSLKFAPVGYHQRFFIFKTKKNSWIYTPHVPSNPKTAFQKALAAAGHSCRAYPFAIGNFDRPKTIVILEGQWDAATWYGAAGLADEFPPDLADQTAIFGLRGAEQTDNFLADYGQWIATVRPKIWVIPDNDKEGLKWVYDFKEAGILKPSLVNRLRDLGSPNVVSTVFSNMPDKSDFNDYFRQYPQKCTPARILNFMQSKHLL